MPKYYGPQFSVFGCAKRGKLAQNGCRVHSEESGDEETHMKRQYSRSFQSSVQYQLEYDHFVSIFCTIVVSLFSRLFEGAPI